MISVGSTQLSLRLELDSALGGVLQGMLVLFTVLVGGWQLRRAREPDRLEAETEDGRHPRLDRGRSCTADLRHGG